jgi:hypothetical protein
MTSTSGRFPARLGTSAGSLGPYATTYASAPFSLSLPVAGEVRAVNREHCGLTTV